MVGLAPVGRRTRTPYVAVLLAGCALLADVAFDPAHRHVPLCPLHAQTGLWCPLCGGLRAADALAHFQLRAAVHDNLLLVAALPVVVLWWLDWVRRARDGRPGRRLNAAGVGALVTLAVAFAVLRNLPLGAGLQPS